MRILPTVPSTEGVRILPHHPCHNMGSMVSESMIIAQGSGLSSLSVFNSSSCFCLLVSFLEPLLESAEQPQWPNCKTVESEQAGNNFGAGQSNLQENSAGHVKSKQPGRGFGAGSVQLN
jgi:hypothetical protein